MSRVCECCGKGKTLGNQITTRGKAKYLGGFGTKVTGITRREFLPNLQNVRITTENGTNKTVRICVQCIRSGAVKKRVRNAPFQLIEDKEKVVTVKTKNVKTKKK
ncbi:MAG: 50S ribosomal protein L28 [Planctomycetaceae bacterium]|nr:50S ribosomal protein L28 [Planctomycetaceae bacterium]